MAVYNCSELSILELSEDAVFSKTSENINLTCTFFRFYRGCRRRVGVAQGQWGLYKESRCGRKRVGVAQVQKVDYQLLMIIICFLNEEE